MKIKKIFVSLFISCMIVMSFSSAAFASVLDDLKTEPNGMAMIAIDNVDCKELDSLGDLQVHVSVPGTGIDITIPVEKVEADGEFLGLWLGYPKDRISDAIMNELASLQKKIDLGEFANNPEDFLTEVDQLISGVQIDILGLPEGHYTVDATACVLTNEIFGQIVDLYKALLQEYTGEFDSFSQMINALLTESGITMEQLLAELSDEEAAAIKDLIENIDPVLEYLSSSEFSGFLIAGANLTCQCPSVDYFQIIHKYYERVNGKLKLVATTYEGEYDELWDEYWLTGTTGQVIKASDYIQCQYEGKTYKYLGSYDSNAIYDNYRWAEYKQDSLTVGDWDCDGLVLRYVIEGAAVADNSSAPATGDKAPIGLYLVVLLTAIAATGAVAAYHKRR